MLRIQGDTKRRVNKLPAQGAFPGNRALPRLVLLIFGDYSPTQPQGGGVGRALPVFALMLKITATLYRLLNCQLKVCFPATVLCQDPYCP